MEEILNLLKNPTIQIIGWFLGGVGWIIGIVAAWLQWSSYKFQKNDLLHNEEVYLILKRNLEGKYTEEQIIQLSNELINLQKKIKRDIPIEAKRVFLEDQLSTLTDNLSEDYEKYLRIPEELKSMKISEKLPQTLDKAIENAIMPNYLLKRRNKNILYGALVCIIIILVILVYPFVRIFLSQSVNVLNTPIKIGNIVIFLLFLIATISLFIKYLWEKIENWFYKHSKIGVVSLFFSFLVSLLFLAALLIIVDSLRFSPYMEIYLIYILLCCITSIPITMSIIYSLYQMTIGTIISLFILS